MNENYSPPLHIIIYYFLLSILKINIINYIYYKKNKIKNKTKKKQKFQASKTFNPLKLHTVQTKTILYFPIFISKPTNITNMTTFEKVFSPEITPTQDTIDPYSQFKSLLPGYVDLKDLTPSFYEDYTQDLERSIVTCMQSHPEYNEKIQRCLSYF